jgi:hypothetical protein
MSYLGLMSDPDFILFLFFHVCDVAELAIIHNRV